MLSSASSCVAAPQYLSLVGCGLTYLGFSCYSPKLYWPRRCVAPPGAYFDYGLICDIPPRSKSIASIDTYPLKDSIKNLLYMLDYLVDRGVMPPGRLPIEVLSESELPSESQTCRCRTDS